MNTDFWRAIDELVSSGKIIIDRPKGSCHPKFQNCIYEVDYGYVENTSSMDGGGIDVWVGSLEEKRVNALICTVDLMKRDSEIKLLMGCKREEIEWIYSFHNESEYMKGLLILRENE